MTYNYYFVPVSFYSLFLRKGSKEGEKFTLQKLDVYLNWKRKIIKFLLKLKILPVRRIGSSADIVLQGNRRKEIFFDEKKISTFGDHGEDYKIRKKMNKYFNCIKNPKYSQGKLEEDLIWPNTPLTNKDLIMVFKQLINYYKLNLKEESEKEIIEKRHSRSNKLNQIKINKTSQTKFLTSKIHGDFWKGNIEKEENGKVWVFDWGQKGEGLVIEDFINYFLIEFFSKKKIDKYLFKKIFSIYQEEFDLRGKEIFFEIELNKINRPKKQWGNLKKIRKGN